MVLTTQISQTKLKAQKRSFVLYLLFCFYYLFMLNLLRKKRFRLTFTNNSGYPDMRCMLYNRD